MTAEPVPRHLDPHDPQAILADLAEDEREFFLSQYEERARAALDPAGYGELHRMLRLWRFHADAAREPGYREAREAAHRPASESGGMLLEDAIRLYRPTS